MRANLARHARHLVVSRAAIAPSCAAYAAGSLPRRQFTPESLTRRNQFRRTFLDVLFKKPPREIRQPQYEPGWMQIMVWRSRMLDNLRPQPREELVLAWRSFLHSKIKNKIPFNTTQAMQCRRLLEYLAAPDRSEEKRLSSSDLLLAGKVLLEIEPMERSEEHLKLAKVLYTASVESLEKPSEEPRYWSYLLLSMSRFGGANEALQELYAKWDTPSYSSYTTGAKSVVPSVAKGLAREGNEDQLVKLIEFADSNGYAYANGMQEAIVDFFAKRNRIPETQKWFTKPLSKGRKTVKSYQAVASFATRNNLQEWVKPLLLELGQEHPEKRFWDALLRAMLLAGMTLGEVKPIMSHMLSLDGPLTPDIETFNSLLRAATEMIDLALAKSIFELSEAQGIRPNEETYLVLLSLYISSGSLADAKVAFQRLQEAGSIGASAPNGVWLEYFSTMNEYLLLLCRQQPSDFGHILELLAAVEDERIHLEPSTVASLCLRFLENEQNFDVMDILSVHAFLYSEAQREVVQASFVSFCLDRNTSTSRAWGAYQLLGQFFQDLSFERRVQLLQNFFDRKRPDMATYVFGHMRQHRNRAYQPTLDTYVQCFEGFAKHPDREGTEMIHNMLKMDTRVQPNTRLYTALMLAHTSCGRSLKALDFWHEITQSAEGPSYESLQAVFWTLEKKSNGDKQARQIWGKIELMDLEVPPSVYMAYIGAIAGSGHEKEVRGLIMKMASVTGSDPDAMVLGATYNALPGQELQAEYQEWAETRYHQQWAELKKKGRRMTENGLCQFRLNRVLKA
ncbi:unnamed protein product [Clonostachys rosea f. rosea IK726]|uniref:Complex I intermediate-associated protein 84, mitochondrial n=2 Tax=Bionectria ochroleuca TaxID=29856 RepID=A0A0B7K6Q3_BIOOC|nr:unnamed protein product [Clonostachys rosea f. rosea IK726]